MSAYIAKLLRETASKLEAAGIPTPRLDAEVLLAHVLGCERLQLPLRRDDALSPEQVASYEALVAERLSRKPVSHILGEREFWSLKFKVSNAVLTPRPDSETLIAAVLERLQPFNAPWRLLDIGTGSGCLIGALLSELPNAWGCGIDISPAAVEVAAENIRNLGLASRCDIIEGDLFAPLEGERFDVIISNPPYIESAEIAVLDPEVSRFEPLGALDGGPDGLNYYRRIADRAHHHLSRGGFMALEIGASQGAQVVQLLSKTWSNVDLLPDLEQRDRVVIAKNPRIL